jgi:phospholipid-translocating P-type ATPase (flippase)
MTIVVEEGESCIVYSKGADSSMFPIVIEPMFGDQITEHATAGLRTLVFAMKELDSGQAESWKAQWHEAATLVVGRDEAIAQIAPQVESQLECIGASAVEDKLQSHVPEAIDWLRKAGMRVWVLTGDKLETAVEIGRTSAVISENSAMLIISQDNDEAIINQFQIYRDNINPAMRDPVLILTARASELALESQREAFLDLADRCRAVIFSRVSPFQKASIVALIKSQPGVLVLAIGDGANDVGMLQEAHVGIGVKGREGSQAVQTSDLAIPRFRHLIPLLGVDGHWASVRLTGVALFMLYKNFAMICVYIWSSIDTMGSPTDFYDQFLISFFNLLFTLLPPFAYGFFERDCRKRDLLAYPHLYRSGFNPMKLPWLIGYFALGLWQSIVVYYIIRLAMPDGALQSNGNLAYVSIVTIIAVQFLLWSSDWNWIMILACALTVVLVFSILVAYAYTMVKSLIGMVEQTLGSIKGWAVFFACVAAGNLPYVAIRAFVEKGWPSLQRLVRERERLDDNEGDTLDFWELMQKIPGRVVASNKIMIP